MSSFLLLQVILIPLLAAEGGETGITAMSTSFVDGRRLPSLEDIEELILNKEIEYPIATQEEIQDRSKGDVVAKAHQALQTI